MSFICSWVLRFRREHLIRLQSALLTPITISNVDVRVDQLSEENLIMKRSGQRCARVLTVTVLAVLCGAGLSTILAAGPPADWPQWGRDPQHSGEVNWNGQNLNRIIEDIVYDPFVAQEQAENGGNLLVHYQVPIINGNDVYMEFKSGNFTHPDR